MAVVRFDGVWPMLATPFTRTGNLDTAALTALVEWYLAAGVSGLFALADGLGESANLMDDERVTVAEHVLKVVAGRVPVVVSAVSAVSLEALSRTARALAKAGAAAVAIAASQFAPAAADETSWRANVDMFLLLTPVVPLVAIESADRALDAATLAWLAATRRFVAAVDASENALARDAKLAAIADAPSPMALVTTDVTFWSSALAAGGSGLTGVGSSALPAVFVWLARHGERSADAAARVGALATVVDSVLRVKAPASLKLWLSLAAEGAGVDPFVRAKVGRARLALTDREARGVAALVAHVDAWRAVNPLA